MKIQLFEPNIHRNETTFRPYVFIQKQLSEVGIQLCYNASSYDVLLIGQASISDKKKSLQQSVEEGTNLLKKITGNYIIIDGQDSTSLIGTIDVFRNVYNDKKCKLFLKTSYLRDKSLYKKAWNLGRMYWGEGDYSIPDIDLMLPKMKLSGMNWLSTIQPTWNSYNFSKKYDVWAYFQYPMNKDVYEHGYLQSIHYDTFRRELHKQLEKLENKYKIISMKDGNRIPLSEYYELMYNSKIVLAPFGYGEMAPRDIETAMFGNILLKNNMNYIETIPNPYIENETYISLNLDFSNLESVIEYALRDYELKQKFFVENMKEQYIKQNNPINRVMHLYNLLKECNL